MGMVVWSQKYKFTVLDYVLIGLVRRIERGEGEMPKLADTSPTNDIGAFFQSWFEYYSNSSLTESEVLEIVGLQSVEKVSAE